MLRGVILSQNQNSQYNLRSQNQRNAQGKFQMLGFMAEKIHAQKTTDTATNRSHQHQRGFRNTPAVFLCLDLINEHKNQSARIDYKKIDEKNLGQHIMILSGGSILKKVLIVLMMAVLLCGCTAGQTFETVEDVIPVQPVAAPQQFYVSLPEEAATPTFTEDNAGQLYVCDSYTVSKLILESGDFRATVRQLTGKEPEELQIIKTKHNNCDRYDFVWTAAGEDGLQLGRACVLDDGNYHYALTVMAAEERSGELQQTLQEVFASCKLLDPEVNLRTGS